MESLKISTSFKEFLWSKYYDNKVARLLLKGIDLQKYDRTKNLRHLILKPDLDVNYLTLRDTGQISFLPKGKEHKLNENGDWSREGRQDGKPSRVIRKVFTNNALKMLKDSDFEDFANYYQARCLEDKVSFKVLGNEDIVKVYCENLEDGGGSLNGSCMNGDADYVSFYEHFNVGILCLYNGAGQLAGRSLLWYLPDGRTFMDRVYVTKDSHYNLFVDYAKKQGDKWFWRQYYKTYDYKKSFTNAVGREWGESLYIRPTRGGEIECDYYPYIDTFTYGDDYKISNDCSGFEYEYNCTDGTRSGDGERYYCEINGEYYHEDEIRYVERGRYRGCYVHEEYVIYVSGEYWTQRDEENGDICEINGKWYETSSDDVCEVDGDWHLTDDCTYLEDDGEYVLSEDAVYSERDDKSYRIDDCVETENEGWVLKSEAYEVDGRYYHESEVCKAG
jgi:hypothetical protein